MGTVTNIEEFRPHIDGKAVCLQCGHRWHAIAPVGTVELECTECGTWKGVFEGMTVPDLVLECNCGNQHFYICHEGAMCAKCGSMQSDF